MFIYLAWVQLLAENPFGKFFKPLTELTKSYNNFLRNIALSVTSHLSRQVQYDSVAGTNKQPSMGQS